MSDLDDALERFQNRGFEYAGGLTNQGPMAVEALVELGHSALIPGFVDAYEPRLPPLEGGRWIPPAERVAARGRAERLGDWRITFERELKENDWPHLVRRETSAMIAGLFAGGTHGLLRVAHALRSLERDDTPVRRRELAFGLAYWAGCYQELPGVPGSRAEPGWGPADVLARIEPVPQAERIPGSFSEGVRALDSHPGFAEAVGKIDLEVWSPDDFVGELCRSAVRFYLQAPGARIAYVHAVTGPSALRLLLPYLERETARRAAGYALQAAAALHAVSSCESWKEPDVEVKQLAEDPAEIRYRAACSLEAHAIQFSEACLRENSLCPDPVFRIAAADAALHL